MPEKKTTRYIEVSLYRKTAGLLENSYRKRAFEIFYDQDDEKVSEEGFFNAKREDFIKNFNHGLKNLSFVDS